MKFLQPRATTSGGSQSFALCIPYWWRVPDRGTAEFERARKPSSSAPATLRTLNIAPTPASGAPTFGVSAPGPVAVAAHYISCLNQMVAHQLHAAGSTWKRASKSNHFIAEATSDEQGAELPRRFCESSLHATQIRLLCRKSRRDPVGPHRVKGGTNKEW